MDEEIPALFKPIRVGPMRLQHRVVLAPLTRNRANSRHAHTDMAVTYYSQRATEPGTLLISEAITIVPEATGRRNVPGIWSEEQIAAWKRVSTMPKEMSQYTRYSSIHRIRSRTRYTRRGHTSLLSCEHMGERRIRRFLKPRALSHSYLRPMSR